MANQLDEVNIRGLRATHFEQIAWYIHNAENEGCYYGNKAQYEKRQREIKQWIANLISMARDENNIIPKTEAKK